MLIFGTLAPFVRNIGVASGELALYRSLLAIIPIGAFMLLTRQRLSLEKIKKSCSYSCYRVRQWALTGYYSLRLTNILPSQ